MKPITIFTFILLLLISCGKSDQPQESGTSGGQLSEFELKNGIGPVAEPVSLGNFEPEKAQRGRRIFSSTCLSCHHIENRLIGPAYGDWLENRTPEYIMNFTMNPGENIKRHPVGKALLEEYMIVMPDQNISITDARAIVEYLRSYEQ